MERPINMDDLARHSKRTNKHATSKLLSILGRKKEYVDAINSELGLKLFEGITNRLDELFEKIAEETATSDEKMEFRVTRKLLQGWASEIHNYIKAKEKLQKA